MSKQPWLKNYPVRWNLIYPEVSLYQYLREKTSNYSQLTALVHNEETITFQKMHDSINRFAGALTNLGVKKGDRVALIMPNCPEYVYAYYACMKIGAIEVQVDPLFTSSELELALNDSGAKAVVVADIVFDSFQAVRNKIFIENIIVNRIAGEESLGKNELCFKRLIEKHSPFLEEAVINPKKDIAVLQYTGGTTGTPKAAMLTHYNLVCNIEQKREWFKDCFERYFAKGATQHYGLAIMPFFHATGMTAVMNFGLTFPLGLLILPSFDVETTLELINQYQPVFFMGVPTIFNTIAKYPNVEDYNLSAVEIWRTGGAPMPLDVIEDFEARMGIKIIEGYGLTEASPTTHANPFKGIRKFGSIGFPFPDTDCLIVDPEEGIEELPPGEAGELIIKGPQIMKGYWNRPEETSKTLQNGWLYTGDIAKMDSGGYFYIVDRKKDLVITGGLNVYPREVDEVITDHPKVAEAISAGIPDDYYGEVLKTYVVPKNGENLGENELIDFCAQKLAIYKVPSSIEFRQELPKSNAGKLLRRALIEQEVSKKQVRSNYETAETTNWEEEILDLDDFDEEFNL